MAFSSEYSKLYNLFYQSKKYPEEVEYIQSIIQRHQATATSILDLGCGTGQHAFLMAEKGYDVTGIDRSEEMLSLAKSRLQSLGSQCKSIDFTQADIRTARLGKTFDVITSLFHVMSYLTSNDDLAAAFDTVRTHLKPGGIFIFDCWYGPAVLSDKPKTSVKRVEDETFMATRIAEPVLLPNENQVCVNCEIMVRNKKSDQVKVFHETHNMRYLFQPEVKQLLKASGLNLIEAAEWVTGKEPGCDSWGVCFLVRG